MAEVNLITLTDPRAPAAEAYRTLRTNLMFYSVDRPINTLVMTSPAGSEFKSAAVANLAVTLAQGGHTTILVDCDLREPQQHTIWGVDNAEGLTSMLLDNVALENPPLQAVGVENLHVLPSGTLPPNPADLVGAKRMDDVIAALKERADYVLFDAPPSLMVTDAALLGLKADGLLLVVRAGSSRRDHAARAKAELERVHVPIIGTVLVNAPRDNALGGYYARKR
ncbi:MAG: CpsD/CapB family tyrosine-protein kinase [Anaerolineae bacterium]|nr:CpsD/CapB family tyrosine-protein kinase [Anaerolineae bacterium]